MGNNNGKDLDLSDFEFIKSENGNHIVVKIGNKQYAAFFVNDEDKKRAFLDLGETIKLHMQKLC